MTAPAQADLRYPIGRPEIPDAPLTAEQRAAGIAELESAPGSLRNALAGLTQQQLDTPYRPGGWTVRQLVHHMADSHMHAYIRTKHALTETEPTIKPYDEKLWAELPDSGGPVEGSLMLFEYLHQRWAALLGALEPAEWQRTWIHPERPGVQTLDRTLLLYVWHSRHHTAHITSLRTRMGWV